MSKMFQLLGQRRFGAQLSAWLLVTFAVAFGGQAAAAAPNPQDPPPVFVQAVADALLSVLKADPAVRNQDVARINEIVQTNVMPYVNFEKTTRLSAGKHWRDATPEQRAALVEAFRSTLVRTYAGALSKIDNGTSMEVLTFRGDENAKDVVVPSSVVQGTNVQPIRIDYRLEKTPEGWRIYDLNVENIWLIQNYRGQFSQEINRSGIDGLIAALNKRNNQ
jgi:phospholipid transport system substrate-binding protein